MISTAPLIWLANTITGWHFAIWLALGFALVARHSAQEAEMGFLAAVVFALASLALAYAVLALIFGQIFGDTYRFEQIWFTSLVLGVAVSATFVLWVSIADSEAHMGFLFTAFVIFSLFLGAAFNLFLYVMPHVVGWGIYEFPKQPWGVKN